MRRHKDLIVKNYKMIHCWRQSSKYAIKWFIGIFTIILMSNLLGSYSLKVQIINCILS